MKKGRKEKGKRGERKEGRKRGEKKQKRERKRERKLFCFDLLALIFFVD